MIVIDSTCNLKRAILAMITSDISGISRPLSKIGTLYKELYPFYRPRRMQNHNAKDLNEDS